MSEPGNNGQNDKIVESANKVLSQLEGLKKKYDILKWIAGIGIGLAVGGFTVGIYLRNVLTYIDNRATPPGMIAFFKANCPPNWPRADELRGRYVVGVDPNHLDDVGKVVGIALENGENRPTGKHTHQYVNTVPVAGGGRDRMMGGGGGGFADPTLTTDGGADTGKNALKEGTNAPYIVLSACRSPD